MNIQNARTASADSPLLRERRRPGRGADAEPPGGAQQPVRGACLARSATRCTTIAKDDSVRAVVLAANGPAFCAGHDLKELTVAPHRRRRRPRLLPADHDDVQRHDAADRHPAPAGDRGGARRRLGGRLPARRKLRSRRRLDQGRASPRPASTSGCSARRRWWRCRATSRASTRWRCCSPARSSGRKGRRDRPRQRGRRRPARSAPGRSSWRKQIASKSSHVVGIGKAAFYRQIEMPLAEAYDYASKVMTENMMARDAEEGICAFIEKRDPTLGRPLD